MLRLYHSPLACSLACRLALAELGIEHDLVLIDLAAGEQKGEAYLRLNPRGKVPTLVTDDGVLTENSAILPYLADLQPQKALMPPPRTFARAAAQAWLATISTTVHPPFTRIFRPELFVTDPAHRAAVVDVALGALATVLLELNERLSGQPCLLEAPGVADLYLLVFCLWRSAPGLAGRLPALPAIDRFQAALLSKPALQAVVADDVARRAR